MIIKIMRNLIRENKTLLFFIITTSILTAVIGCFIYGVYENYRIGLLVGESTSTSIHIKATEWSGWTTSRTDLFEFDMNNEELYDEFKYNNFSSITKGDILKVTESIPESMYDDIEYIHCGGTFENDLFGLAPFEFYFKPTKEGIVNVIENPSENDFTDEEYINGERHIIIPEDLLDPNIQNGTGSLSYTSDWARTLSGIGDVVSINGVEYTVSGLLPDNRLWSIPFTSLPDDTLLNAGVSISYKQPVTYNQYKTICDIVNSVMPQDGYVEEMDLSAVSDLAYYKTIIYITAAVALLFAVNLTVLYKYIIECNKKRITVFRLCGSTRGKCIRLFLAQAVIIITPVFTLSLFAFHKVLYPKMVEIFPNSIDCLNFKRYVCILVGYIVISVIVLLVMLMKNIGRKLNFTEANI